MGVPHDPAPPEYDDLRNVFHHYLTEMEYLAPSPRQYEVCEFIQHGPRKICVQAYRRMGKTSMAVLYCLNELRKDASHRILYISASGRVSGNNSTWMLQLMREMDLFRHLLPPTTAQRQGKLEFDINGAPSSKDPSVASIGLDGQLTGRRPSIIVVDDVETDDNTETQHQRLMMAQRLPEIDSIIEKSPRARVIYLGTPHTEESVYRTLTARRYVIRMWPQRYPTTKHLLECQPWLAPSLLEDIEKDRQLCEGGGMEENLGKPADPSRFDEEACRVQEEDVGATDYRLQFILDTSISDQDLYPLRIPDLRVMALGLERAPEEVLPSSERVLDLPCVGFNRDRYYAAVLPDNVKWSKYKKIAAAIDPSGFGSDETGLTIGGILAATQFYLWNGGFRDGRAPGTMEKIAKTIVQHRVQSVVLEENYLDGYWTTMFTPILNRVWEEEDRKFPELMIPKPGILGVRSDGTQKMERIIDALETPMRAHRVVVDTGLVERDFQYRASGLTEAQAKTYMLFYQLSHARRQKDCLERDDRLESFAMLATLFKEWMAEDQKKALAAAEAERNANRDKELDDTIFALSGQRPKGLSGSRWNDWIRRN